MPIHESPYLKKHLPESLSADADIFDRTLAYERIHSMVDKIVNQKPLSENDIIFFSESFDKLGEIGYFGQSITRQPGEKISEDELEQGEIEIHIKNKNKKAFNVFLEALCEFTPPKKNLIDFMYESISKHLDKEKSEGKIVIDFMIAKGISPTSPSVRKNILTQLIIHSKDITPYLSFTLFLKKKSSDQDDSYKLSAEELNSILEKYQTQLTILQVGQIKKEIAISEI